jgi:hypothetical protein
MVPGPLNQNRPVADRTGVIPIMPSPQGGLQNPLAGAPAPRGVGS